MPLSFIKNRKGAIYKLDTIYSRGHALGNSFHLELEKLGFPTKVCAQIYFASHYGNYGQTIMRCGDQLLKELEHKKKLKSLLTYPLLLILFLLGMLLMMRF